MIAPEIVRTAPRLGVPETVVSLVALREAVKQWPPMGRRDLVGSYDCRPLPITLRRETEAEASQLPSFRHMGPRLRMIVHHGPGALLNLSGPLDPLPVVEELAAFEDYQRSKRWFSRAARQPEDRVLVVEAEYRGRACSFEWVMKAQDLAKWVGVEDRSIGLALEGMDRYIDRLVMVRIAGPEVMNMIEGYP